MKVAIPIAELANRGALPAREPLRVVDLGAGCGALALGLAVALPTAPSSSSRSTATPTPCASRRARSPCSRRTSR